MAKKDERFVKTYSQGKLEGNEIWVDKVTGVNYLFHFSGYAGGITPLLDENGKPVITKIEE
ncbi:MAG: DUF6440 family protein [Acutalibacteraceae bacterium]|nr:DUF6440 family protein [Acutalibacteraceae bacterium]